MADTPTDPPITWTEYTVDPDARPAPGAVSYTTYDAEASSAAEAGERPPDDPIVVES